MPEWKAYRDYHAEIQVRTVLQHAWAAVSHKLTYKHEDEAPETMHRSLARLSALLEQSDLVFSDLKKQRDALSEDYLKRYEIGQFDCELNLTSLVVYLNVTHAHERWSQKAVKLGYRPAQPWLTISANAFHQIERAMLERLRDLEVQTIDELHKIVESAENWGVERLDQVLQRCQEAGFVPVANPHDIIPMLIIVSGLKNLTKERIQIIGYRPPLRNALCAAANLDCFARLCDAL